ncbi:hypothetical protein [Flavobacterium psychrotrophum]|uniref:hypothetical protein n=1 Tax=Flavobacterium psychrotrophum TaxID=2294119 RepID=UPI0013C4536C|nr:hypothetical protein [Flavobacterium psychrotrophum]
MWTTIYIIVIIGASMIISSIIRDKALDKNAIEKKLSDFASYTLVLLIGGVILINVVDLSDTKGEEKVTRSDFDEFYKNPKAKYESQLSVLNAYRNRKQQNYEWFVDIADELDSILLRTKKDPILSKKIVMTRDSLRHVIELIPASEKAPKRRTYASEADIDKQFSKWDGSHIKTEEYVKAHMKNPDSYEHVTSEYKIHPDYLEVILTYRGTNSYGGIVTEQAKAKCDLETGEVLEIN